VSENLSEFTLYVKINTMKSKPDPYKNLQRDLFLVAISVFVAILFVRLGVLNNLIGVKEEARIIGSFISGIFFTSAFTIAPASISLAEIAKTTSPFIVAFWGALGSVVGDMIIFLFVRDRFSEDLIEVLKLSKAKKLLHFFHKGFFRWLSPFLGALIIASPLPDELGLALLGLSHIRVFTLAIISFVMSFVGILLVSLVSGAF
jgi:uncharacterized membrane protein YdjX (TVP38/TMEM64 family)